MARIIARKADKADKANGNGRHDVFAEIDAKELDHARNDPAVRRMADAGDRHLRMLRRAGRIR